MDRIDCRNCGGDGFTLNSPSCPACNGTGRTAPTICRECGTNLHLWPAATIGRCTPAGHYLITRRAPRLPNWGDAPAN